MKTGQQTPEAILRAAQESEVQAVWARYLEAGERLPLSFDLVDGLDQDVCMVAGGRGQRPAPAGSRSCGQGQASRFAVIT